MQMLQQLRSKCMNTFILFLITAELSFSLAKPAPVCPVTAFNTSGEMQIPLLKDLLTQLATLVPTKNSLQKCLKAALLTSINGTSEIEQDLADALIIISHTSQIFDMKPSACPFAEAINGTVAAQQMRNRTLLLNTLKFGQVSNFNFFDDVVAYNAKKSSGCVKVCETPKLPKFTCFNNGFVYDIEAAWDLYGDGINKDTRCLVRSLYDSKDFTDNYLAAIVTRAILPFSRLLDKGFNVDVGLELLSFVKKDPIPKQCCCERLDRIEKLKQASITDGLRLYKMLETVYAYPPDYKIC